MERSLMKLLTVACLSSALALASFWHRTAGQDTSPPTVGRTIADFALKEPQGRIVKLSHFADCKAIVVLFLGTECPINNQYLSRLAELQGEFRDKGVQFLAIN